MPQIPEIRVGSTVVQGPVAVEVPDDRHVRAGQGGGQFGRDRLQVADRLLDFKVTPPRFAVTFQHRLE